MESSVAAVPMLMSSLHASVHDHVDESANEGREVLHLRLGGREQLETLARARSVVVEELQQRSAGRAASVAGRYIVVRALRDCADHVPKLDELGVAVVDLKVWLASLASAGAAASEVSRLTRPKKELCWRKQRQRRLLRLVVHEDADCKVLVTAALENAVDRDCIDKAEARKVRSPVVGYRGHAAVWCRTRYAV